MEAINKYYLINGYIEKVEDFSDRLDKATKVIYEVLRVVNGKPLFVKEHIDRMEKSFNIISKPFPYNYNEITGYLNKVINANNNIEGNIKITFDTKTEAIKIYYIQHSYPSKDLYDNGVKTILYHGERENPNAKIINNNFRELVNAEIVKANAYEAILVDRNGFITEGSKSNIFMISGNTLITAKAENVLRGVTRDKIILLAKENGIKVEESEVYYKELSNVDAMFISGTSPKILPIKQVDNIRLDVDNKVLRLLMEKYEFLIN